MPSETSTEKIARLEADVELLATELVARQDELVTLLKLQEKSRRQLEIEPLSTIFLTEVRRLIDAEGAFVCGTNPIFFQILGSVPGIGALRRYWLHNVVQAVCESGKTTLFSDLGTVNGHAITHVLATPITIQGEAIGALGSINAMDGEFGSRDRKLMTSIGSQFSAHLENVLFHREIVSQTRIQSELIVARQVQTHLLPQQLPPVSTLDIAATSRPANEVGGDFYDVKMGRNGLNFIIGDVSGKGVPAALLMTMVRTTFRNSIALAEDGLPVEHMHFANQSLYDDLTETSALTTAFFAQYHEPDRMMHYANAGHSPVVLCPVGGSPHLLEADGTALGILRTSFCEAQKMPFRANDLLLIGSDGLVEQRNQAGEMFGYERLFELFETLRGKSAEKILESILFELAKFGRDVPQDDDQTIVVIKGQ